MGVPHVFLSGLTANTLSEIYCLAVSQSHLLVYGAIDKLPVRVLNYYDNPGLTDKLVDEKLQFLSEPTLKFFKSEPNNFEIEYRRAGVVAKAIQSRLAS